MINVDDLNTTIWVKMRTKEKFNSYKRTLSDILKLDLNSDKTLCLLMMGFDIDKFKKKYVERMSQKR